MYAGDNNSLLLRDNPLALDLTRRGTLFKLWDSIRRYPLADNVRLMLLLLRTMMRDRPFEEMFFYEELLQSLSPDPASADVTMDSEGLVDQLKPLVRRVGYRAVPSLEVQGYRGFNILWFRRHWYALALSLGSVDLAALDEEILADYQARSLCLTGCSLDAVERRIDALMTPASPPGPVLGPVA